MTQEQYQNGIQDLSFVTKTVKLSDLVFKYEGLVHDLSLQEYQALKSSIIKNGVQIPIEINDKNEVLDGNHRAKIAKEIGFKHIEARVHIFSDELREKIFAIDMNLKRRHSNDFQKAELFIDRDRFETELARQRSQSNLKVGNKLPTVSHDTTGETGRTRDKIAKESGLSPSTYSRAKKIVEYGDQPTIERLRSGRSKIGKEHNKLMSKIRQQELRDKSRTILEPDLGFGIDNLQLIHGDFREKCKTIPDNSIDIIFTDPPYALEYLSLYRDLGELAMRVLKDGSSLITYVGHHVVSEVIGYLRQAGLEYVWLIAIKQSGPKAKIFKNNIHVNWKPLLWFSKGSRAENKGNVINDLIESESPPDKSLHEWAQSTVEAKYLIKYLTVEGQTVLDPFMGSGTTVIAAMNLGRKFIGIEIDENRFNVARGRIAEKIEMLKNNNDAATTSADSSLITIKKEK